MKIIILGAGQVGTSAAASLSREDNDITVVDLDAMKLRELQDRLDLRTVQGFGSYPSVLERAGAQDADLLVALTNNDETNMTACQVAYALYKTPKRIARVRAREYLDHPDLFGDQAVPIDVLISPEQIVTEHIQRLIEYPGALQVLDFADGRVRMVAVRTYADGPLVGHQLSELRRHMPSDVDTRVAAVYRRDKPIIPEGDTVIEAGDEVFFIAARNDIRTVMRELRRLGEPAKRIVIAGGGNIGQALAKALENRYYVKLIERDREHARRIAEGLEKAIVLVGDCADEDLLREENIDQTDVYCALTNDDEANILSSLLGKRMGAGKVMTLINRPAYVDLVEASAIDIAISPQQVTIGALLTHVRRGDLVRVHSLRRGAAEAIEAVAHGDSRSSKVVGRTIQDIELPPGTTIGGIVRGEQVLMAHHDLQVEAGDHLLLFVVDKRCIGDIENLFQPSPTFL